MSKEEKESNSCPCNGERALSCVEHEYNVPGVIQSISELVDILDSEAKDQEYGKVHVVMHEEKSALKVVLDRHSRDLQEDPPRQVQTVRVISTTVDGRWYRYRDELRVGMVRKLIAEASMKPSLKPRHLYYQNPLGEELSAVDVLLTEDKILMESPDSSSSYISKAPLGAFDRSKKEE